MQTARREPPTAPSRMELDRSSFVPLYYQLQEALKEQIESGVWAPGEPLPSEPELARRYRVSRIVVRQALAILADDHQVDRVRGRGTFVAQPKLDMRAGGLSRLLVAPRTSESSILVLDNRCPQVERSIREHLGVHDTEEVLRVTTLLSLRDKPLAITYSFFRRSDVGWLEATAQVGRRVGPDVTLSEYGLELAPSQVTIEASQCGQFEADRFGIAHRSAVFLVHCTERVQGPEGSLPFEFARVEYRADMVQFQLGPHSGPWWPTTGTNDNATLP